MFGVSKEPDRRQSWMRHKEIRTQGAPSPVHERSQNEHGWFWTLMHKSLRHH